MGTEPIMGPFLAQRQAVVNAEAVLLIDNNQPEPGEDHILLNYGVSSHRHLRFAASQLFQLLASTPRAQASRQPTQLYTQRLPPGTEVVPMLLREDFSGGHDGHLKTTGDGAQGRQGGYQGFAGTNVALQQAQHGCGLG